MTVGAALCAVVAVRARLGDSRPSVADLVPFAREHGVPLVELCAGFGWLPALDRGPHGQRLWVDVLAGPGTPRAPATEGERATWAVFCRLHPRRALDGALFRYVLPIAAAS